MIIIQLVFLQKKVMKAEIIISKGHLERLVADGWQLDDDKRNEIDNLRIDALNYCISLSNQPGMDGSLSLSEPAIKLFVEKAVNESNYASRIRFLEDNEETYKAYGGYWLLLSTSYFEANKYENCLKSGRYLHNLV